MGREQAVTGEPDPARLAALDQQLAEISDRLSRHTSAAMRGDVILACLALAIAVATVIARPHVPWWVLAVAALTIAMLAAGNFMQARMLRTYQAEVRDLRSRIPT